MDYLSDYRLPVLVAPSLHIAEHSTCSITFCVGIILNMSSKGCWAASRVTRQTTG